MAKANIEQQITNASNTIRDLAVNLCVAFIIVSTESREGELRYSLPDGRCLLKSEVQ